MSHLSGQAPFVFSHRTDLHALPAAALPFEVKLHGGFAIDPRSDGGHIYYGMPGCGLVRVTSDLQRQEVISLPDQLAPLNFHSTKIGRLGGEWRLFMPAESAALVAVVTLDGRLDFVLPRPELEAYAEETVPFRPTDTALVGDHLYVADGYGANYIAMADVADRRWVSTFGGKTENPTEDGKFATAHGMRPSPTAAQLAIADRPHSRIQMHGHDGQFLASHKLPAGAWPCGIDFIQRDGRSYAVIGCLKDPVEGRPAPIYILDGEIFDVLSTIRPKEELGIEPVQHLHNVVWHVHGDQLYLVCQSWNPGHYFVLEMA